MLYSSQLLAEENVFLTLSEGSVDLSLNLGADLQNLDLTVKKHRQQLQTSHQTRNRQDMQFLHHAQVQRIGDHIDQTHAVVYVEDSDFQLLREHRR